MLKPHDRADPPPTFVAIVLPPFVRLRQVTSASRQALADAGLTFEPDASGDLAVRFAESGEPLLANPSFVETFARLNRAGIAFAKDYTQAWSPASIVRQLQRDGRVSGPFTTIEWRGMDTWVTALEGESSRI